MREEWRPVVGYEGYYEVSNLGNVRGVCRQGCAGKVLKPSLTTTGYPFVVLSVGCETKSKRVHRIVAEAFIPNPDNMPEVNHINGDKADYSIGNLEWCSHIDNMRHAVRSGLWNPSKAQQLSVKSKRKSVVRNDGERFESLREAADKSGTTAGNVCKVLKGIRQHANGYSFGYEEVEHEAAV